MKSTFLALLGATALAVPAGAQTTYIGGAVSNGDLESGALSPFDGIASTISTDFSHSGTHSMKVDLQANNGEGRWKLLHTSALVDRGVGPSGVVLDVEADVLAGNSFNAEMWVYVPGGTGLGNTPLADVAINLEASSDGGTTFTAAGAYASTGNVDITGLTTDTWHKVGFTNAILPAGTTHVQTRAWFVATTDTVNGKSASDAGTTAADWLAEGYSGFIYIDDFKVESVPPPDPNIIMRDDVRNGNMENVGSLAPWGSPASSTAIETNPTFVHSGAQSMSIDLTKGTGKWKQFGPSGLHPAVAGDRIKISAWVYVPSVANGTTLGTNPGDLSWLNLILRSDKDGGGQGQQGFHRFDLKQMQTNGLSDQWVYGESTLTMADGTSTLSTVRIEGFNIQSQAAGDQVALGYNGFVYLDDVQVVNLGPPSPGVLVDADTNNGDIENVVHPWVVNGAASVSSDFDHTTGSGQSVKVDLTANNGSQKWKALKNQAIDHPIENYTKADVSAWVYIPSATTIDDNAKFNLVIRDGTVFKNGGPSLNLQTAARDTWIEVSALDIDVSDFTTSLAINNWNIETVNLLGPEGSTVRADGKDGTVVNPPNGIASDLPGPAAPADWIAAGYDGFIYFDDISVRLHSPVTPAPIEIHSIDYDNVTGGVTLNYSSTFEAGADVYYSNDMQTWSGPQFALDTGANQSFAVDMVEVGTELGDVSKLYFILVEPEGVFP